jgi:hypothetical protein
MDGKLLRDTFQISDSDSTGKPDMSAISQAQIRIKDDSRMPITLELYDFFIEDAQSDEIDSLGYSDLESCNCVAFGLNHCLNN